MAECSIASVQVLNNPAQYTDPIVLEVQYECLSSLQEDLEWRISYVGSAESEDYDQVLDSALVGPVIPGHFKFRMEAPAPDPSRIPADDLLGVTALLLTCSYKGKEFVRVGYYVNIEYTDPELLDPEKPKPHPPIISKLQRNIMADHPRVTKFPHDFDNDAAPMPQPEAEPEPDDDILPDNDNDIDDEDEESDADLDEDDAADAEVENVDPSGSHGFTFTGGKAADQQIDDMDTDMRLT
eukprot:GHRR01007425.1.p1 GENE.GHRR01007425.1~~GHRR01007425.1.p1  ORF type:complete len:239 (+),score=73.99 GHRR01007425.1:499-1215(+)